MCVHVCACECVCVRVCVRACVRACVCVCVKGVVAAARAAGCWLLAVGCWLLAAGCWLLLDIGGRTCRRFSAVNGHENSRLSTQNLSTHNAAAVVMRLMLLCDHDCVARYSRPCM